MAMNSIRMESIAHILEIALMVYALLFLRIRMWLIRQLKILTISIWENATSNSLRVDYSNSQLTCIRTDSL